MTGTGERSLRCFGIEDTLLREVLGDASCPSEPGMLRLLFRRLDEENVFRRPVAALVAKRAGEPGTEGPLASMSSEVTLVSVAAVEKLPSASMPGYGEDPLRPGDMVDVPAEFCAGSMMAALVTVCCQSGETKADLGGSGTTCGIISGAGMAGCSVFGLSASEPVCDFVFVSIFSALAFIPDNLRSRTLGLESLGARLAGLTGEPFGCLDKSSFAG